MSDININQGAVDPSRYMQPLEESTDVKAPGIIPIRHEDDVIEDASALSAITKQQLHLAPVLFQNANVSPTENTTIALKSETGKPINYPAPSRYNDMLGAAAQLSASGEIPLADFIKTVQEAIQALQEALQEQQQQSNTVDKQFHRSSIADGTEDTLDYSLDGAILQNANLSEEDQAKVQEMSQRLAADPGVSNEAGSMKAVLEKLMQGSGLDPKIGDLILVLAQLQYLQKNQSNNVTGGVILGNHPEIVVSLQKLGIELPTPNPNVPFAGMSAQLAAQNKPPYNDPAYKELANTLPKGWEVISLNDLGAMMQGIAQQVRTAAGKSYGILAKPLQGLFGSQLFSIQDPVKMEELKLLVEARKVLNQLKNQSEFNRLNFARENSAVFEKLLQKGLIEKWMMPVELVNSGGLDKNFNVSVSDLVMKSLNKQIDQRGGEKALQVKDPPPDPNGLGRIASGAIVGGMNESISDILNSLFETEMNSAFQSSTLPSNDKKGIQDIASITLLTTVLGDALHSTPVLDAKGAQEKLEKSIQMFKDSGIAKNILDSVMQGASSYQRDILQEATQAFMVNIGAATSSMDDGGINTVKAYNTLSNVRSTSPVASDVASARAFWDTKASQLDDAGKFETLARQIAPNADHDSGKLESQENLREMIKMLKKILEQLLSGGQSTEQLSALIKQAKDGISEFNAQNYKDIPG